MPSNIQNWDDTKNKWLVLNVAPGDVGEDANTIRYNGDLDSYLDANQGSVVTEKTRYVSPGQESTEVDKDTIDPPPARSAGGSSPRSLSTAGILALTDARPGERIFNTDNGKTYYYDTVNGSVWKELVTDETLREPGTGDGPSGIYGEGFESGFGNWFVDILETDPTMIDPIRRNQGSTPSNNTGPNGAHTGSWYIYLEASSPNNPNKIAYIKTTHFAKPTAITFNYHMFGDDMGSLTLQAQRDDDSWDDIWTISGEQQTSAGQAYNQVNLDLTTEGSIKGLRFKMQVGSGFESDIALDDITIVSVDP